MAFIDIGWASLDWFIWVSVRTSGPVYMNVVRNLRVLSDTENCVTAWGTFSWWRPLLHGVIFGTLKELRLYFFLYHSSKHRWHEPVLSWSSILCNPSPSTNIHFAKWWGLFCSSLDIHNDKKSYRSLYSNLSCKSRSTSSFSVLAYVVF